MGLMYCFLQNFFFTATFATISCSLNLLITFVDRKILSLLISVAFQDSSLLNHMRQLMRQQLLSPLTPRLIRPLPKENILSYSKRLRLY